MSKSKEEVESVNEKLKELTPEELEQVNGGYPPLKTGGLYTIISQLSLPSD